MLAFWRKRTRKRWRSCEWGLSIYIIDAIIWYPLLKQGAVFGYIALTSFSLLKSH